MCRATQVVFLGERRKCDHSWNIKWNICAALTQTSYQLISSVHLQLTEIVYWKASATNQLTSHAQLRALTTSERLQEV